MSKNKLERIITYKTMFLISLCITILLVIIFSHYYIQTTFSEKPAKLILSITTSVLSAFIVGAIIQIISDGYLKKDELDRMQEMIKSQLSYYLPAIHSNKNQDLFLGIKLANGFKKLEIPQTLDLNKPKEINLLFVGFEITYFSTDFNQQLNTILKNKKSKIKLLLLNPYSEAFRARCIERNYDYYLRKTQVAYEKLIKDLKKSLPELNIEKQLSIKIYNDYPAFTLIKIDEFIWFTPMWNKVSIKEKPFFSLNTDRSEIFDQFKNNFNLLWNNKESEVVNPENLSEWFKHKA